jgi:DNA-binding NarL/FixJ family response regulator
MPALGALRGRFPAARLVVLASAVTRETVLLALSVGIHGFIPKRFEPAEIVEALEVIMMGHMFVPSSLAELPIVSEAKPASIKVANGELTARERQIIVLAGTGMSYAAIARQLEIAPGTVKVHVTKAYRTLGAHSKLGAIRALEALETGPARESEADFGLIAA